MLLFLQSLLDQREGDIDFDREVRKITGSAEEAALKTLPNEEAIDTVQQQRQSLFILINAFASFLCFVPSFYLNCCWCRRGGRGRAQSFDEAAFISQLTLLDVQVNHLLHQPALPELLRLLTRGPCSQYSPTLP